MKQSDDDGHFWVGCDPDRLARIAPDSKRSRNLPHFQQVVGLHLGERVEQRFRLLEVTRIEPSVDHRRP